MKTVDVVVGIIFRDNKFLVERRKTDEKIDPGIVCLPGGHVEKNENRKDAFKREMREELSVEVKKSEFLKKDFWVASNGERQNVYYYMVTSYEGEPTSKTAKEIIWVGNTDELDALYDRNAIEKVRMKRIKEIINETSTRR
ncbi:MAG TPA: NUDIX domain-containing protein [Candidatus Bathyarchaeia archaeon]|nr:NUDIX domain-containing protein [Candidatus Bathyarchaeia archaeon]